MSVRSRVAFASGVAGLIGATLLLSGRFDGSAVLALLFAWGARVAADASVVDAGPILASGAFRRIAEHASFAPAWALAVAAGIVRAGSSGLADLRGANHVAGLALVHGETIAVAGAWCAVIAGAIAVAARTATAVEAAAPSGAVGRVVRPVALRRLEAGAVLAQTALLATLFFGPQVSTATDAVWWAAGVAVVAAVAWEAPRVHLRYLAPLAALLAAAGLALVLAGGSP